LREVLVFVTDDLPGWRRPSVGCIRWLNRQRCGVYKARHPLPKVRKEDQEAVLRDFKRVTVRNPLRRHR